MKSKFKVTICKATNSHTGNSIHFEIDTLDGHHLCRFALTLEQFAEAITGLGARESLVGDLYPVEDRMYKVCLDKSFYIPLTIEPYYKDREPQCAKYVNEHEEVLPWLAEGWQSQSYFNSQDSFKYDGKGNTSVKVTLFKYVFPEDIPSDYVITKWMQEKIDYINEMRKLNKKESE